ncbi:MAG TPA: HAMP domain-containing sensor histidine kinase [Chloroflexia bacterium]|nr:HAMP domain-containing sensor histidine kinase [Chloroflexia bacterium]
MFNPLSRISIRTRLTLVYSGVVCFALIVFILVVYRSVVNNLESEVDSDLYQRATQAQTFFSSRGISHQDLDNFVRTFGGVEIAPKATPGSANLGAGSQTVEPDDLASALTYLQLVDPNGNVLRSVPDLKLMSDPSTQSELKEVLTYGKGYSNVRLANGERARVYTLPLDRIENRGYVQVVRSLQEVEAVVRGLFLPFFISAVLAVFLLGLFGWWFTRRTFGPIKEITETAYRIGVNNNLSERIITDPNSNDEVSRLGRAFNAMLDRLEKNFKAQKQFVADSSHELRTPLTVIRGNVDLLKRNPDPQNQIESLQAIDRESARMQRLVQDLLLLAQADARQTVEMAPLQLDDVVLEVFKETRVLADQKHQQLKLGHFDPAQIEGDRDRLKRAVLNLVDNAIKYTPEEGVVSVSLIRGKQWARVVVSDTGPGIEPKDQPLVFDRFYRIDKARSRAGGGTGLGLAIVKHIVEAHGGRISLESEPDKGSTFTIWLKLDPAETLSLDGANDEEEELSSSEEKQTPVEASETSDALRGK